MEQPQLGRYVIDSEIGRGAMGVVFKATDSVLQRTVAVKTVNMAMEKDHADKYEARFYQEARAAGGLNHPNIVTVYDAGKAGDVVYMAMEYIQGVELRSLLVEGQPMGVAQALSVAAQVAEGLGYAHQQGVVHRDIKPANIMVVSGTNIKVADFGAAYLKTVESTHNVDIGSPYYMSPEQVEGAELGHHSDMFSMGVVLYELFTGKRPFTATKLEELFAKILNEAPQPPSALRDGISKEVDQILLRMMGKTPAERYPTWADLALDIARIGRLSVYQQEIADSDKFTWLKKVPMLERLGEAEIWELVHAGRWTRLPPRQAIVKEGENGKGLFFLANGQAKVTKQGRLLNVLNAGECFGEMAYIKAGGIPRQATVESMADAVIAEFDADALAQTSLTCRLQLSTALLHSMVDRLALANERMARAAQ